MRSIKTVKVILTLGILAQALVPAVIGAPQTHRTHAKTAPKTATKKAPRKSPPMRPQGGRYGKRGGHG